MSLISELMAKGISARDAGYIESITRGKMPTVTELPVGSILRYRTGGHEDVQYRHIISGGTAVSERPVVGEDGVSQRVHNFDCVGDYLFISVQRRSGTDHDLCICKN